MVVFDLRVDVFGSFKSKVVIAFMKKIMLFTLLVLLFTFGSAGAVPIPFQVGTSGY